MPGRQYRKIGAGVASFVGGALVSRESVANFVDVTITNAQMLALRATPKVLVAAPGKANVYREFCGALLVSSAAAGAWTETADNLVVRQTDGTGVILSDTIETTGWLDQAAVKANYARPKLDPIGFLLNKALVLHNTGDGELGGGNAASVVRVRLFYRDQNLSGFGTLA